MNMGVSKNHGTPKWMVKIMVPNPMNKWDDLGGFPIFLEMCTQSLAPSQIFVQASNEMDASEAESSPAM